MSRNFEDEYRNFMADEVPDLWSRIEGNLKEKEPVSVYTKTEIETMQKVKDKKVASIYMKKYAVAAGLCLVILAGGVIAVYRGNVHGLNDAMVAKDMETNSIDSTLVEDAAPMNDFMEEAEMEAPGMEDSEMVESELLSDGVVEESTLDDSLGDGIASGDEVEQSRNQMESIETTEDVAPAMNDNYQLEAEEMEKSSEEISESENVNVQAVVEITSIENTGEETLYYAQVLPSEYSVFEPGTEIVFCIGDMIVSELKMGSNYKVSLEQPMETEVIENGMLYMLKQIELQAE